MYITFFISLQIIFYEDKNFQGRSYECMGDCSDMHSHLSHCHSCKVDSGCFMVYDRPNYMGNQYFMRRGEYSDMNMLSWNDCIRSCRSIPMVNTFRTINIIIMRIFCRELIFYDILCLQHGGQYRMRIYEKENFGGQMNELNDDCDSIMGRYSMSDCMSCNVMDGHWLMYEQPHFRGKVMYMRPGEYRSFRNMGSNNTKFMSMKRIPDMM